MSETRFLITRDRTSEDGAFTKVRFRPPQLTLGVRVRTLLNKIYGKHRWRKMKGIATIRLPNGAFRRVELHWYETHGIGKKDLKIKRYLDDL